MKTISEEQIEMLALRRLYYHSKRKNSSNNNFPTLETYKKIIQKSINEGFKCYYCKKKLKIKDKFPYKDVLSIDHKIPISKNGNSEENNIVICCCRCNIVKGTLTDKEYEILIKNIPEEIIDNMFNSRLANKIERVCIENGRRS